MKHHNLRNSDSAVSPVVGTILMVAVTVILGIAVYAVMAGFGDDTAEASPSHGFKVSAADEDSDGKNEAIRVTYVTGPTDLADDAITLIVDDVEYTNLRGSPWNPGNSYSLTEDSSGSAFSAGNHHVLLKVGSDVLVDKTVRID